MTLLTEYYLEDERLFNHPELVRFDLKVIERLAQKRHHNIGLPAGRESSVCH